jgi:RimJ/RimL family protein N-acetyltransferase
VAGETFSFAEKFGYGDEELGDQDPHPTPEDLPLNQRFEEDPDAWSFANEFGYADPEPEPEIAQEEESGYLGNIGRGMAGRAATLGGGLAGGSAWAYKKLGELTGIDTSPIHEALENVAQSGRDAQQGFYGYDAERNSWEDLKADYTGDTGFWETAGNTIAFGIEQGSVSIPDMVVAVTALPVYITARTGEIAHDRAKADGRDEMNATDVLVGSATAAAVSVLEKFGAEKILKVAPTGSLLTGTAKGAGVGGVSEAGTEFLQEALEYTGVNLGTEEGYEFAKMVDQALAGLVGGGTFGTAAGGVSGGVQSAVEKKNLADQAALKAIEDAQKRAEDAAAEAGGDALDQAQAGEEAARVAREAYYKAQADRLSEEQLQAAEEEEVRIRAQEQSEAADRYTTEPTPTEEEVFAMAEEEAAQVRAEEEAEARYQAELQEGEVVEQLEDVEAEPEKLADVAPALAEAKKKIQTKEKVAKIVAKKKISDANRAKGKQKPAPKMLEDKSPDIVVNSQGKAMKPGQLGAQKADFVVDTAGNAMNRAQLLRERKRMEVDAAAGETPLRPSELNVERRVGNLKIALETMAGMKRTGKRADGSTWSTTMRGVDYGFVRGSKGADGDQVDVFINSAENADYERVFLIDQMDQNTGTFDEHKAMVGFPNQMAAVKAYKTQYQKGWKVGPVTEMSQTEFEEWSKVAKQDEPVGSVPEFTSEEDFDSIVERVAMKTGKKPKVMFSLPDGMSIQVKEDFGLTGITPLEIAAYDATTDEIVGIISAVEVDDTRQIRIGTSALAPSYKGKRIGLEMYNAVMKRASELGYEVTSDFSVSPDAQRVYAALERRGAVVTQNPNAAVLDNGTLMSNEHNEPVYRVQPAEIQLSLSDLDETAQVTDEAPEDTHERYVAATTKVAETMPGMGKIGEKVHIVRNPTEAPSYVTEAMMSQNGMRARGVFFPHTGEIYVFTENVSSERQAVETLIHEGVTHKGLRILLGERLSPILDEIWNSPGMAEKVTKHRDSFMYKYDLNKAGDRRNATEEYVAHLSEIQPDATILRRIKDAIRQVLRSMGVLNEWTDNDINALIRESAKRLRYTPLEKIKLETEVEIEETGEVLTVEQPADVMWRRVNKRMAIAEKIGACLRS